MVISDADSPGLGAPSGASTAPSDPSTSDDGANAGEGVDADEAPDPEAFIDIPLEVGEGHDGYRLDRYLAQRFKRLSRNRIHRIIALGRVSDVARGEALTRKQMRVRAGQQLMIHRPPPDEPDVEMDYAVLHEDAQILVIDKPAGLPVHPSARYLRHTLTALMTDRLGAGHGWEMAHRLDRETSGVLIFGQKGRPARVLKGAFFKRVVKKTYLAITHGTVEAPIDIDIPLGSAAGSRINIKMGARAIEDGGLEASTRVEPVRHGTFRGEPVTLVRALPRTGRTHQIRAHLSLVGHGIVGDKMYGLDEKHFLDVVERGRPMEELEAELGLHRHALHAVRLEVPHPLDGHRAAFEAPWPPELEAIVPASGAVSGAASSAGATPMGEPGGCAGADGR